MSDHRGRGLSRAARCAILVLLVLPGCTLSWLYEHADWLVTRQIDGWVDLTATQREWLHGSFGRHWRWHREQALPQWAGALQGARDRLADGLDAADLRWIEAAVVKHSRALARRVLPDVARLLADLGPDQVDRVAAKLDEGATKAREELAKPDAERVQRRADAMVELLEDLVGDLDDAQEALARRLSSALPLEDRDRETRIAERRAALVALLRGDRAKLAARLRTWFIEDPVGPSDAWQEGARRMALELDAALTPRQRLTALGRLDRLITDLKQLAARR